MGKRSQFERIEKDFYRTIDPRAVEPLLPFLVPNTKYAEPCWGMGDLERLLWHGNPSLQCAWASDFGIGPEYNVGNIDALTLTKAQLKDCDMIITNPPWSRPILHAMIEHFVTLKPTWLLFDADWAYTRQSAQLIKDYCTDIVSVGRLKWIPGTTMSGKDNCAWYHFRGDKGPEFPAWFHGRQTT